MTETFEIRHLGPFFESFAFLIHQAVKINHEAEEGHEEFTSESQVAAAPLDVNRGRTAAALYQRARHYGLQVRTIVQLLFLAAITATGCGQQVPSAVEFAAQRQRMVEQQLKARGIKNERVLTAMAKVPREEFVPADERAGAYEDHSLPIGYDQTISQPYIVAFMTEQLQPKPGDHVLEVGSGSGYQAAILAELVADVYTIEIIEPLAKTAEATLQRLGCKNVHLKIGDGYKGWPEQAPFDAIIVTCAPDKVPPPLVDQLKDSGRMIIPVGERFAQQLYLLEKKNGQLKESVTLPVRFVPMRRQQK